MSLPSTAVPCAGEGDSNDRAWANPDSRDGKLWVWEVANGRAKSFAQHRDSIWAVATANRDHRIATASIDGAVKILDLATETTRVIQSPSKTGMLSVQFSKDDRWISAVPRLWANATVWDVESGKKIFFSLFGDETVDAIFFAGWANHGRPGAYRRFKSV